MKIKVKTLALITFTLSFSFIGCNEIKESKEEVTPEDDNKLEVVTVQITPEEKKKASERMTPEKIDSLVKTGKANVHYKDGMTIVVIDEEDKIITKFLTEEEAKTLKSNK